MASGTSGDEGENYKQLLEAQTHIWNQGLSFINSASLKCALDLAIPDAIFNHGKPMTLSELVAAIEIKPEKANGLKRLMRVLIQEGFISNQSEDDEERYALTPASEIVLKHKEYNLRAFVMLNFHPATIKSWYTLSDWFRNDDVTAFRTAHGEEFYDFCSRDPMFSKAFNELVEADSILVSKEMMRECKEVFDGLTSLVDVGGGTGKVAKVILQACPNLKCTVLDLPHVVGNLQGSGNLKFVVGDMFVSIPSANAVLLKYVMHNWEDEECIKVLKKCKEAIPGKDEGGKVIIIDMVMDDHRSSGSSGYDEHVQKSKVFFDILMMTYHGGKERNVKEWEYLFTNAGFSDYKITNKLVSRSLIELYP